MPLPAHQAIQNARQLRLLALQAVGVGGDVGNTGKVEFGQQTMLLGAVLKAWRDQTLRDHWRRSAERVQHVERRRMEGRGARLLTQVSASLEYGHRPAGPRQLRRGDQPD